MGKNELHTEPKQDKKLICVLCGQEWGKKNPFTNRCENEKCSGVCSWGYELNNPESFFVDDDGKWHLKEPPKN
jgi:hypothetical protein